jgi:hypothetical protein
MTAMAASLLAAGVLMSPSAAHAATHTPQAGSTFAMPNVKGMILQDAQDLLQTKGSYLMDQQDARGLGRWQLLDSNWRVCWQKPRAGTVVSTSTIVTLGSVKLNERCP